MSETTEKLPVMLKRPASRWRNRYFNFRSFVCENGFYHPAGEYVAPRDWPSRDTAETYGQWWAAHPATSELGKYLGAFPVETA